MMKEEITIAVPCELSEKMRQEADRIGCTCESYLLLMLQLGIKLYQSDLVLRADTLF